MIENRGPQLTAAIAAFLALTWTTFAMRCWVRIRIIKNFAVDDWLTLATLVFFSVYAAFVVNGIYWGTGRHFVDLTVQERVNGMKSWWMCEPTYIFDTALLRVAVGAFLLRIAIRKLHRQLIWSLIIVNVAFNAFYLLLMVFQCIPVDYFYLRLDGQHHGKCNSTIVANSTYAQSALSAMIDWTFGVLPLFIIWDLQMNQKKKILVGMVLSLAALASAATIIRLPYIYTITHSQDFLWDTTDIAIWSSVEPGIGITALNIATLRPLFRSFLVRIGLATASQDPAYSFHGHTGPGAYSMGRRGRDSPRPQVPAKETGYSQQDSPIFDEEAQLGLSGLSHKLGTSSHVEAGPMSRPADPVKSEKRQLFRCSSKARSIGVDSEETLHITKTMDIVTWSGQELIREPEKAQRR